MPELPEVETVANGVHARVRGQRITGVWTSGKPQTFKSPEHEIAEVLTGATIDHVRRVGKTIVVSLTHPAAPATPPTPAPDPTPAPALTPTPAPHTGISTEAKRSGETRSTPPPPLIRESVISTAANRSQETRNDPSLATAELLVHLGMTGRLLVADPAVPLPPHTHAVLTLSSTRELRFVDPRRFGRLSVRRIDTPADPYGGPGAEPLTITEPDFVALFRGRRTPIKAALLNQSLLHGVGNIYADEALARAGIRPRRQAARLTRAQLHRLRATLLDVLHRAIELGGSSVSDYVDAEGVAGFFQLEHRVYARAGKPCRTCGTPIKKITVAGRGTHFCPTCQK